MGYQPSFTLALGPAIRIETETIAFYGRLAGAIIAGVIRQRLLEHLAAYPLCDFFLRQCIENMSDKQILDDLSETPDQSLLLHFDKPEHMTALEDLFARTIKTFNLSKDDLKAKADFNFDVYDMTGFESIRAVFRLANALSEKGFRGIRILRGERFGRPQGDERWSTVVYRS